MTSKLEWTYDNVLECDVATISDTLRVRAVRDDCPSNPLKEYDGHWPMLARVGGEREATGEYETPANSGVAISTPFNGSALPSCRTPDQLLVHDQRAFATALGLKTWEAFARDYLHDIDGNPQRYCRNGDELRDAFMQALSDIGSVDDKFNALEAIYKLLGIPVLNTTVRGYSQGDWTDLLIVGVPEKEREFQGETVRSPDAILADLAAQAELYRAWAFGDCYGYVLERAVPAPADNDETGHCVECGRDNRGHAGEPCLFEPAGDGCPMYDDGANVTWEELDSCWGYYGDHDASGLEDAALEAAQAYMPRAAA